MDKPATREQSPVDYRSELYQAQSRLRTLAHRLELEEEQSERKISLLEKRHERETKRLRDRLFDMEEKVRELETQQFSDRLASQGQWARTMYIVIIAFFIVLNVAIFLSKTS